MPNRKMILAVAAVAALAACNSPNINDLYGYATATPAPTATPVLNPSLTSATVTVTVSSSPLPNQKVYLYTSTSTGNIINPSAPIAMQTTNPDGETIFSGLAGASWYCFQTTYTGAPAGSLTPTQTDCTQYWGAYGVTFAFP
jgi:hypothetical protein